MSGAPDPGIASVVVALNPHDDPVGRVLDAWAAQRGAGDYEVIVVDDGSRETTRGEVDSHRARHAGSPVRLVRVATRGRAASNNAGVRESRGALLLFVADDFRPSATLVAAHRRFHALGASPAVGVGPGFWDEAFRDDPFRRWIEDSGTIFGIPFPAAGLAWRHGYFYVGNASMSRATFEAVGPFDERFRHDAMDDYEWSLRLGSRGIPTRYVPRAIAWHEHDVTIASRVEALRKLGCAARQFEALAPPPWPWTSTTARSVESIEAAFQAGAEAGHGAAIGDRIRRWSLAMSLGFLRGYHDAGAGHRP